MADHAKPQNHLLVVKRLQHLIKVAESSAPGLEQFLAIAEARYILYLDVLAKTPEKVQILPPWDVAIVSYAHHLAPFNLIADLKYRKAYANISDAGLDYPVTGLASLIKTDTWYDEASADVWEAFHPTSPYQLWSSLPAASSILELTLPSVLLRCPYGGCECILNVSAEKWTQVRNYDEFVSCIDCERKFGKVNMCLRTLWADCEIASIAEIRDVGKAFKGAAVDIHGQRHILPSKVLESLKTWAAELTNSNTNAENLKSTIERLDERNLDGEDREILERLKHDMILAYECNPWPNLSVDLVDAVKSLSVLKLTNSAEFWFTQGVVDFEAARERYMRYAKLLRRVPSQWRSNYQLVPTADMIFCAYTHQLSPAAYHKWCEDNVGRRINTFGGFETSLEANWIKLTEQTWAKDYEEPYLIKPELETELYLRPCITSAAGYPRSTRHNTEGEIDQTKNGTGDLLSLSTLNITPAMDNLPATVQTPIYRPLPTRSTFRLLCFSGMCQDGRVQIHLEEFDLKVPPQYCAISYVWGEPFWDEQGEDDPKYAGGEREILCNGIPIKISANGFALLEQLCAYEHPSYLWMDAICINQSDLTERSQQVSMMHEIYSKASEVIAWLGPEHELLEDFRWASSTFRIAFDYRFDPEGLGYSPGNEFSHFLDPSFWQRMGLPNSTDRLRRASLFSAMCTWFIRTWIVQEAVLARDISLLCGSNWLDWKGVVWLGKNFCTGWRGLGHFDTVNGDIDKNWLAFVPSMGYRAWELELYRQRNLYGKLEDDHPGEEFPSDVATSLAFFLKLIRQFRSTMASDPRDKIYALLGIAKHFFPNDDLWTTPIDASSKSVIAIDYRADNTPAHVYTEVAKLTFKHLNSLHILCEKEAEDVGTVTGLPSWVPDFSWSLSTSTIKALGRSGVSEPSFHVWHKNRQNVPLCEISGHHLILQGIRIGIVDDLHVSNNMHTLRQLRACIPDVQRPQGMSRIEVLMWTNLMRNKHIPMPWTTTEKLRDSFRSCLLALIVAELWLIEHNKGQIEGPTRDLEVLLAEFPEEISLDQLPSMAMVREYWNLTKTRNSQSLSMADKTAAHDEMLKTQITAQDYANHYTEVGKFRTLIRTKPQVQTLSPQSETIAQPSGGNIGMEFVTRPAALGIGSPDTLEGDEIWMLHGGDVPFVLRRIEERFDNYELIGECYLHGYMYGEAFEEDPALSKQLRTVILI